MDVNIKILLFFDFNVTAHPTMEWTARQLVEAFPWDSAPRYLLRDNDRIYGEVFLAQLDALGIEDIPTAPRSPWRTPYVERLIGTVRRECLDHVIVLRKRHLSQVLTEYVEYYNESLRVSRWRRIVRCLVRWNVLKSARSDNVRWSVGSITGIIERPLNRGFEPGWNKWQAQAFRNYSLTTDN